jgi:hypothetical protein
VREIDRFLAATLQDQFDVPPAWCPLPPGGEKDRPTRAQGQEVRPCLRAGASPRGHTEPPGR